MSNPAHWEKDIPEKNELKARQTGKIWNYEKENSRLMKEGNYETMKKGTIGSWKREIMKPWKRELEAHEKGK